MHSVTAAQSELNEARIWYTHTYTHTLPPYKQPSSRPTLRGDASAAERIHKVKKRAARVITESPHRTPSTALFEQLRYMFATWPHQIQESVFKSVKGLAPDYMCELFESVQMVSSRNIRSNARDDLYVPRARTQLFQNHELLTWWYLDNLNDFKISYSNVYNSFIFCKFKYTF